MKKITKLIAFVLVLVLGVILVACGNKGGGDNTATTVNERYCQVFFANSTLKK